MYIHMIMNLYSFWSYINTMNALSEFSSNPYEKQSVTPLWIHSKTALA